jgi:formylglycine-generating enzyme required for sulfatase activity
VVTVNPQGQITNRKQASAPYQTADLGQGVTLDTVLIPGGNFLMGQTDAEKAELIRQVGEEDYKFWYANELPQHEVTLTAFWMGKYPVTKAQYQAITGHYPSGLKGDNLPAWVGSWLEAMEFCDRLSAHTGKLYTLPSEAQWEYACRAGTTTPFHFGETITTDLANYDGKYTYGAGPKGIYRGTTTDVGSFPPNRFGLYDMHGNVLEWCLDHYHDSYKGAPNDGSAWIDPKANENETRILRGGSWRNSPKHCRCAFRNPNVIAAFGQINHGFRVVCAPPGLL